MAFSAKDHFFNWVGGNTVKVHPVTLPGGYTGYVREMSAHERTQFEMDIDDKKGGLPRVRELLVARCACDETGDRIFDDSDATRLGTMPASVLEPFVTKAREVNGLVAATPDETKKN